jgi:geranylgeranyl transferase type-2 subunit beta
MERISYLQSLNTRLADGLARMPDEFRTRHATFVRAAQNRDGGFSGREGGSDLYYTGFALRSLAVLDALVPETCERVAGFLRANLIKQNSVIDFFSWLYSCLLIQVAGGPDVLADSPSDWPDRLAAMLESFRTPDGGYPNAAGSNAGSTYHTFLVALLYQLLGRPVPRAEEVLRFVSSRQRDDGGFVEFAPMRRSGTNPTAAAVGILQMLPVEEEGPRGLPADGRTDFQSVPPDVRARVVAFLAGMPSHEGGLRANGRIPVADLLSTFTGTWTLHQLGALERINTKAAYTYALEMERSSGGFRGGRWDEGTDIEYTFYGLGVIGLLTS